MWVCELPTCLTTWRAFKLQWILGVSSLGSYYCFFRKGLHSFESGHHSKRFLLQNADWLYWCITCPLSRTETQLFQFFALFPSYVIYNKLRIIKKFCTVCRNVVLRREDLTLPWRPVYELYKETVYGRNEKCIDKTILRETILCIKKLFPLPATREILQEVGFNFFGSEYFYITCFNYSLWLMSWKRNLRSFECFNKDYSFGLLKFIFEPTTFLRSIQICIQTLILTLIFEQIVFFAFISFIWTSHINLFESLLQTNRF